MQLQRSAKKEPAKAKQTNNVNIESAESVKTTGFTSQFKI